MKWGRGLVFELEEKWVNAFWALVLAGNAQMVSKGRMTLDLEWIGWIWVLSKLDFVDISASLVTLAPSELVQGDSRESE